ncbi:uncharacterized protein [Procambarus clarkii]|uniref:uncharacterized protein isoform X1 n=1 Tax=Procambarus clarkii TaxID=6728 RepID=UPI003743888D
MSLHRLKPRDLVDALPAPTPPSPPPTRSTRPSRSAPSTHPPRSRRPSRSAPLTHLPCPTRPPCSAPPITLPNSTPAMANATPVEDNSTLKSRPSTQCAATESATEPAASHPHTIQPQTNPPPTIQSPTTQTETSQLVTNSSPRNHPIPPQSSHTETSHLATNPPPTHYPAPSQPLVTENGRRDIEPITKKRRLLEATESAEVHEITKPAKQEDVDILARVCSAVGIDSDLVVSVVDDPPPSHQSATVSSPLTTPAQQQYLRVRPSSLGIPLGHRLRRPEFRVYPGMYPVYRSVPDGSYAVAEVRHPYHQYQPRPHDPAYPAQHHMHIPPGEPQPYRHYPQYPGKYHLISRPPMLRPGAPPGPADHRLTLPRSSPGHPDTTDLRSYPPPTLHRSPSEAPVLVHDPRLTVPDMHHSRPRHQDVPYGIPTALRDSPGMPPPPSEQPAGTLASLSYVRQVPGRPDLQSRIEHQNNASLREVYIPVNSSNMHHAPGSVYSVNNHQPSSQYRHMHPRAPEAYPKHSYDPRSESVMNTLWHKPRSPQTAAIMSSHASPDRFRTAIPVRSPYTPEQLKNYDSPWSLKRPADGLDKPPERIQTRRVMEPPKPCVELIPLGPPPEARKSINSFSTSTMRQEAAVIDPHRQKMESNISHHVQPPSLSPRENTYASVNHSENLAPQGHPVQWRTHVVRPESLNASHHQASTISPQVPASQDHPPFRRCLSSEPSFNHQPPGAAWKEAALAKPQRGQGHSRSKSDTAIPQTRAYNNYELSKRTIDCMYDACKSISSIDNTDKRSTSLLTHCQQIIHNESSMDNVNTSAGQVSTWNSDKSVEKVANSVDSHEDNKQTAPRGEEITESHHIITESGGTLEDGHVVGPGQLHSLHSSRHVNHHRPASEPPLRLPSVTNNAASASKRPASLPGAGQQHHCMLTSIKLQNNLPSLTSHQNKSFVETPSDTHTDEVFMGRLRLVLNDLLSVPEASKLQQGSCSPEQQLVYVLKRGGARPSEDPNPQQRLREDFMAVVKLCLPPDLLQDWGWKSCTPDQILDQLIKVATNGLTVSGKEGGTNSGLTVSGEEGANGRVRSSPDSPLNHEVEALDDDVFCPATCAAAPPPPSLFTKRHGLVSGGLHGQATHARTSTTYTMHHHGPVPYPATHGMPPYAHCTALSHYTHPHSRVPVEPCGQQMYEGDQVYRSDQVYTGDQQEHIRSGSVAPPHSTTTKRPGDEAAAAATPSDTAAALTPTPVT